MNKLEEYILNITEPFDFSGNQSGGELKIIIEIMQPEKEFKGVWSPKLPEHASGSQHLNVGLDLFSAIDIQSTEASASYHYAIIRTGIRIETPYGYHMMIGSRSGLGFNKHIHAFPGVIDHSYRGEIKIKLYSPQPFSISSGDKIAQGLVFASLPYSITEGLVDGSTDRGEKGFGSTDN
jgi:dUTP pyrophosphatase